MVLVRYVFPEKVPFVIFRLFIRRHKRNEKVSFFYALDFCHVELREYIWQTANSCTQLMRFYFSRISTWFSTEHMDLKT